MRAERARGAAWTRGLRAAGALPGTGSCAGSIPGRLVMPAAEEGAPPLLMLNFDAQAALAEDPTKPGAAGT